MSFDGLVTRKDAFSYSSHLIEAHIDVFIEIIEIQISVSFYLCLGEDLIEFLYYFTQVSLVIATKSECPR